MRTDRLMLLSSILLVACGDGAAVESARDTADTTAPEATETVETPDVVEDAADSALDTTAPDTALPDSKEPDTTVVADTGPADTVNPQADAWSSTWTRTLSGGEARVLGVRFVGGQGTSSLIALFDVTGPVGWDLGTDAEPVLLAGEGHRLVIASLDVGDAEILASEVITLKDTEAIGTVTKGPNGFAVAIGGRIVLAQIFAGALRVATLSAIAAEGVATIALPASGDLVRVSSGGASTALALQIDATAGGTFYVTVGETRVELPIDVGGGIGFLTLPAPTEEVVLEAETSSLVMVPGLTAVSTVETSIGPVLVATATVATTIRDKALEPGQTALLIGAVPGATADGGDEGGPAVPVVLWSSIASSSIEVVQIASSGGGGLVLAGVGEGEIKFGDVSEQLDPPQSIVVSLGTGGGILYSAPECDRMMGVSAGFSVRILRMACDFEEQGPALVLTLLTSDFSGELTQPFDLLLAPLASATPPEDLSGLVSFSVSDGRAYGGLFDFGQGPRLVLAREDGQLYDSGVLAALKRSGPSAEPVLFLPLRTGGGGGGTNALTNAVIYVVPSEHGPVIGRARIDLKTFIW